MQTYKLSFFQRYGIIMALVIGTILGLYGPNWTHIVAENISTVFMRLLKFVSLPIISLSLMSTISGLDKSQRVWKLSLRILTYTILTTFISASLALFLFEIIKPVGEISSLPSAVHHAMCAHSYCAEAIKVVPDNFLKPFIDYNVISVFIISILIGLAILALPDQHRKPMSQTLHRCFLVIMQITKWIVQVLPVAVTAFVTLFIKEMGNGLVMGSLTKYLGVVTSANIIHAFVLLPLILLVHKIPVFKTLQGMFPVLSLAFFSKSSAASMPSAVETAESKLGVDPTVSRFCFPMCTTINMNACAAFILTTVLFVAQSNGIPFTLFNKILWIFIATIAAIGNAGVPMGCFFLTNALLSAFNVPIELMGIILPFYGLLDMLESAVNIWSDSCVTVIVDKWWKRITRQG